MDELDAVHQQLVVEILSDGLLLDLDDTQSAIISKIKNNFKDKIIEESNDGNGNEGKRDNELPNYIESRDKESLDNLKGTSTEALDNFEGNDKESASSNEKSIESVYNLDRRDDTRNKISEECSTFYDNLKENSVEDTNDLKISPEEFCCNTTWNESEVYKYRNIKFPTGNLNKRRNVNIPEQYESKDTDKRVKYNSNLS